MRLAAALLIFALAAEPCVVSPIRKVWAKKPGSESNLFAFERDGRVGFIDSSGKVVIQPTIEAQIEDVGDFSNGRARVASYGYIDETGKWIIRGDYWYLFDFSDGLALVNIYDPNQKNVQQFVLDPAGAAVTKLPTSRAGEFSEGLAPFEAEGKPGVRNLHPGAFLYRDYPGFKGFLDRTGGVAIEPAFADVGSFVHGLARAVLDGYCHVATSWGGRLGTPTTGSPGDCGFAPDDAVSPCKVGFINREGKFAIEPWFESALDFQEGFAAVRLGGLWGFIDTNGSVVIPPRFERAQSFQEGFAAVQVGGKWGLIDKTGILIISPRFEAVEGFSESLAIAHQHQRSFYIDRTGHTRIKGPFREATPFVHGLAAVLLSQTHVAYINPAGKTVFDYDRRRVKSFF
ncbi:MAG: WG repeat-containing protein [Bryobacteraceae bacterium]|jgi:hypothetical protein